MCGPSDDERDWAIPFVLLILTAAYALLIYLVIHSLPVKP